MKENWNQSIKFPCARVCHRFILIANDGAFSIWYYCMSFNEIHVTIHVTITTWKHMKIKSHLNTFTIISNEIDWQMEYLRSLSFSFIFISWKINCHFSPLDRCVSGGNYFSLFRMEWFFIYKFYSLQNKITT